MPDIKEIDPTLVTVGAPAEGGCVFTNFTESPTLPTAASAQLGTGWESLGELSENGFTENTAINSQDHKGWHGTVLLTTEIDETNTYKLEFVEVNRSSVAKVRYGTDNITESNGELAAIKGSFGKRKPIPLVIDELESNGWLRRTVIPKATVTSFDEVPHQKNNIMMYGMTFTAQEVDGATFHIYRAKPAAVSTASVKP